MASNIQRRKKTIVENEPFTYSVSPSFIDEFNGFLGVRETYNKIVISFWLLSAGLLLSCIILWKSMSKLKFEVAFDDMVKLFPTATWFFISKKTLYNFIQQLIRLNNDYDLFHKFLLISVLLAVILLILGYYLGKYMDELRKEKKNSDEVKHQ